MLGRTPTIASLGTLLSFIVVGCLVGAAPSESGPSDETTTQGTESQSSGNAQPYHFRREQDDFAFKNPSQAFSARFHSLGVLLTGDRPTWGWEVSAALTGYGCAGHPLGLATIQPGQPTAVANRIEIDHGPIRSWYVNRPEGLEQGFDWHEPPPCFPENPRLSLELTLDGLEPRVGSQGDVWLRDDRGLDVVQVHHLRVFNATGEPIDAFFRVQGRQLFMDVEASRGDFPLTIDPTWTQVLKIVDSSPSSGASFGEAIDISGDTTVVGATSAVGAIGAAYVLVAPTWSVQSQLLASDGSSYDEFGWTVAVDVDTVIVGAPLDDDDGSASGSAYVFVRNGTTWTEEAKLTASDAATGDWFGSSVGISGNTAVVGARYDDDAGNGSGAAYVFVRNGTTWTQEAKLTASDATVGDLFGLAVAVSGDEAAIAAPYRDSAGSNAGAVYVFERSGRTWTEAQLLTPNTLGADDRFGDSLVISGTTMFVGSPFDDDAGSNAGAVYEFVSSGGFWFSGAKLTASDAAAGDTFGSAVDVTGDNAIIGAWRKVTAGTDSGAAYLWSRSGSMWSEDAKVTASDAATLDHFGEAVAIEGATTVVGAPGDDHSGYQSAGSIYVFVAGAPTGSPCVMDADCASGFCRDGVCCDTACGGGVASDCQSCLAADTAQSTDGTCDVILASASHLCRMGSGEFCDPHELCDGVSTSCPADTLALAGTVCRIGSGDSCDPNESCTGVPGQSCPPDVMEPSTTLCRAGSGDGCDPDEHCTGVAGQACPSDVVAAAGTLCRAGSGDLCDPDEICSGTATEPCPPDELSAATVVCRVGSDPWCDPDEHCPGMAGATCPADAFASDGSPCDDGTCQAGSCEPNEGGGGAHAGGADAGGAHAGGASVEAGGGPSTGGGGSDEGEPSQATFQPPDTSGCGCALLGRRDDTKHAWLLVALVVAPLVRRRRERRIR